MSNNNEKDNNLTVSKVYSTLQSPTFHNNLYWDILGGIKEKNTYKLVRGIAERLINQKMEDLEGLTSSKADIMRKKAIIAEISVMSYTIDTVFSKILYIKLEKAAKEQIVKLIHELREEGKIPENIWSKINLNLDTPCTSNATVKTNSVQQKKGSPKKNIQTAGASAPLTKENLSLLPNSIDISKDNTTIKEEILSDDSDAVSEISFLPSSPVSSVHTSDLSSFDDDISLSSCDENGEKKKISLKEVLKTISQVGPLDTSKANNINLNSSKYPETEASIAGTSRSLSQSVIDSVSENALSKRARKPNSRYSSDNMFCPAVKVKERKKLVPSVFKKDEKDSSDELLPQKKKAKVDEDNIYVDVVTITKSINNEIKSPEKQSGTPVLLKSQSLNRSLTSRRTAPLTLFST